MSEWKGRHFGFLILLCSGWIAGRTMFSWLTFEGSPPVFNVPDANPYRVSPTNVATVVGLGWPSAPLRVVTWPQARFHQPHIYRAAAITAIKQNRAQSTAPDLPDSLLLDPHVSAVPPSAKSDWRAANSPKLEVDVYAYSFWRKGGDAGGLGAAAQYGGGQSGVIATIGLKDRAPVAILVRATVAHDNLRDRELALGMRLQPSKSLPMTITAERRFRSTGADHFAVYAAGGKGGIRLPAGFTLDAFGQAGVVSGQNKTHFFDVRAVADRRILPQMPLPLHIGAGIWTGGQRGATRVDIGPSFRTELPLGQTKVRLTADWRVRVAGNADPGNGPALTLSTGF